jgi:hypothetical protein
MLEARLMSNVTLTYSFLPFSSDQQELIADCTFWVEGNLKCTPKPMC